MDPCDIVRLRPLMQRTEGSVELAVGLIDGPVALDHPWLAPARVVSLDGSAVPCDAGMACRHGTGVAGILFARRGSSAPALCPGCTLMVRPIFGREANGSGPGLAHPNELASAIAACVQAGARVINLSAAMAGNGVRDTHVLHAALDLCARRGTLVVAAAGNRGGVGGSLITSHPWVIPVCACDAHGRPQAYSTHGMSIGRQGLGAPGDAIASLAPGGKAARIDGTSAAAAFVTGAIALLWSLFPEASAGRIKSAVAGPPGRRRSIVPPLLDAEAAWLALAREQLSSSVFHHQPQGAFS